jgi:CheY-like chemotaxis protein
MIDCSQGINFRLVKMTTIEQGSPMDNEVRFLLADSVNIFVELGKMYLKKTGARIFSCSNGNDALAIIESERPDLVFMSAFMPEMDGVECCRLVKDNKSLSSTAIVLTLVSGSAENIECCLHAGCDDVLLKPIDRRTFFTVINKFVDLNKRHAPRFKDHFRISLSNRDNGSMNCKIYDLSSGGLFLEVFPPLPVDTIVGLDFALPSSDVKISCKGRIAWINQLDCPLNPGFPPGMGVEFVDMNEKCTRAIEDYLQQTHVAPIIGTNPASH